MQFKHTSKWLRCSEGYPEYAIKIVRSGWYLAVHGQAHLTKSLIKPNSGHKRFHSRRLFSAPMRKSPADCTVKNKDSSFRLKHLKYRTTTGNVKNTREDRLSVTVWFSGSERHSRFLTSRIQKRIQFKNYFASSHRRCTWRPGLLHNHTSSLIWV